MAYTPLSGKNGKVTYGSSPKTVAVTKWSIKDDGGVLKLPNTTDGMRRIAGLGDSTGTFECHIDVDVTAAYETDLAVGTIVKLQFYTDGTKSYTYTNAIITGRSISNEVEGSYDGSFEWALASGTPVAAPA